jgi:hypothetical protein
VAQAGSYMVIASNSSGSVASVPASLAVIPSSTDPGRLNQSLHSHGVGRERNHDDRHGARRCGHRGPEATSGAGGWPLPLNIWGNRDPA